MRSQRAKKPTILAFPDPGSVSKTIDRFYHIAEGLCQLHYKKSLDYGTDEDTYANFRGSLKMGIPAWQGVFIRLQDKVSRINTFAKKGKLSNESVLDSFNDLAVYGIICRILFEEEQVESALDRKGSTANPERTRSRPKRP